MIEDKTQRFSFEAGRELIQEDFVPQLDQLIRRGCLRVQETGGEDQTEENTDESFVCVPLSAQCPIRTPR